jgi:hypothetical protein
VRFHLSGPSRNNCFNSFAASPGRKDDDTLAQLDLLIGQQALGVRTLAVFDLNGTASVVRQKKQVFNANKARIHTEHADGAVV